MQWNFLATRSTSRSTPKYWKDHVERRVLAFSSSRRLAESLSGRDLHRGEVDEALRIRRGIQLPAFERLGDTRETAVTWGNIAHIAHQRGEVDEAAELQHKRLEVNKQLGDLDGIAAATWDLAQIDLTREDYESAFPRLAESFQIFSQLQRPDGIAAAGLTLSQLLFAAGQTDLARQVLSDSLAAATKIGWTDAIQQINKLLNPPPSANEDT